jgi:hypothetical protein
MSARQVGSDQGRLHRMTAKLIFIIDGQIVQAMQTDERFAAILLSNPDIIDVSHLPDEAIDIRNYDVTTKTFKNPSA